MIEKKDYLKSYMRMDENERLEYLANVEKWTEETYPRLAALDDSWKEADMKDYKEGLKLVTALQKAQGFINTHLRYDAKKRLDVLCKLLTEVRIKSGKRTDGIRKSISNKRTAAVIPAKRTDEDGVVQPVKPFVQPEVSDRRPEHLSQYIDVLPDELKKEAKEVSNLYDQLAHWRGRAEYLATDPRADREMVARAAQKAVTFEEMILNFWARVDMAYEKKTGKKIDADAERELMEEAQALKKQEQKPLSEYTKEDIEAMPEGKDKENRKRARIEANKKYLRRKDVQMTDERKKDFAFRMKELVEWGITPSAYALSVAEENGIEVPELKKDEPAKEDESQEEPEQIELFTKEGKEEHV